MGLYFGRSSFKKTGENYTETKVSDFDPNPVKFLIRDFYESNGNTVILINYPNCKNYEGDKIIVFKGVNFDKIKNLKEIDPHFTNENVIKPFARFEPTKEGWKQAIKLLNII